MAEYLSKRAIVSDDGVFYYSQKQGENLSIDDLRKFIDYNESRFVPDYKKYKDYYKGKHTAIIKAPAKPNGKPDNRVILNFAKKLVDTFNGFLTGNPVKITLEEEIANKELAEFNRRKNIPEVVAEVSKQADIYGKSHFFIFSDEKGEIYLTAATPDETFVIYDDTVLHRPLYGVRYSSQGSFGVGYNVELFSTEKTWNVNTSNANGGLGEGQVNEFKSIPIIEASENSERISVIGNVLSIVDELNKAISEKSNDVDYFGDAYMKVLGALLEQEDLNALRDTRIINLKSSTDEDEPAENLDVDFLSKPDADATQENLINRLLDALYQTSMIVNLNDKDFGNSSGVALEMKFKPMLNLATGKARQFTKSLREVYRILFSTGLIAGVDTEAWSDLDILFHYDLPHDIKDEAQTAQTLSGLVSRKTWLKALSIVNDVQAESDAIDKEQQDQLATNMQVIADNRGLTDGIGQGRKEAD